MRYAVLDCVFDTRMSIVALWRLSPVANSKLSQRYSHEMTSLSATSMKALLPSNVEEGSGTDRQLLV